MTRMEIDRRKFLWSSAALAGGLAFAGPLRALGARAAEGVPLLRANGYGPLDPDSVGDLLLPAGFTCEIISREGELMSDGKPTPSRFDGMAAFGGGRDTVILMRNHENRSRRGNANDFEIGVDVPTESRYDNRVAYKGGVTKVIVGPGPIESYGVLGGTLFNCAGGKTPWKTWISCEELNPGPNVGGLPRHGYIFEVPIAATGPIEAVPITAAGRFHHEAVAWLDGALYETEDESDAAFYRYTPRTVDGPGLDQAGDLDALKIVGEWGLQTATGWPCNDDGTWASLPVEWVRITNPNPAGNEQLRNEAQALGAAVFARTEGCWAADGKVYFDCTNGGREGLGQIFEFEPATQTLTLLFESRKPDAGDEDFLNKPDNLTVAPGDTLFVCEDRNFNLNSPDPLKIPSIRGLTPDGRIFEFARAKSNLTEFCGACFGPGGFRATFFVNQQGNPPNADVPEGVPGVTYAIRGPWQPSESLI
jgi:secreted PhoX family phosphatase